MQRLFVVVLAILALATVVLVGWRSWGPPGGASRLDPDEESEPLSLGRAGSQPDDSDSNAKAAATSERLLVGQVGERAADALRVLSEAEFYARLRELGLDPTRDLFDEIHGQRPDRGALVVLTTDDRGQLVSGSRVVVEAATAGVVRHGEAVGEFSSAAITRSTRADGLAFFQNLLPSAYVIAANHREYLTHYLGSVNVDRGRPTYVEIALVAPDAVIAGRVRDSRGLPLAGVGVTARRYSEGGVPFVASQVTGYHGRFELGVQSGTQSLVTASRIGFEAARLPGVAAGTENLEITLEPTPTVFVSGYVTSGGTDEPVTQFRVDGAAFVDLNGVFRVERNVAPEPQQLVFSAVGFEPRAVTVTLATEDDVDLGPVALFGGKELNGIVVSGSDAARVPVPGAAVTAVTETGAVSSMKSTAAGAFSFRALAADRVRLSVVAPGFAEFATDVALLAEEPTYVEVVLQDGENRVSGVVVDQDTTEPVADVLVEVAERPGLSARTDVAGAYEITGIDLEQFSLRATKAGYRPENSPVLQGSPEGAVWNAELVPSGLRLRLLLGGSPAPVGVPVALWSTANPTLPALLAAQAAVASNRIEARTDEEGTVTFDVPDGSYFVQVIDYRLHPTRVIADQANREWVEVELPGRAVLSGRIRYADGSPVANTSFWLHSGDQDYSTMSLYHTDGGGNYVVPNLAPREYAFSIIKSQSVQSAQHLVEFSGGVAPVQSLNVQLPPLTASIHGRVTDENGAGKAGVQVGVEFLDAPHRSILAGWVLTDPNGDYRVPLLEPGRHRVRTAWTADVAVFSDIVTLGATEDREIDLVAPRIPGKRVRGHMIAADGGPLGGSFVFATDAQGRQHGNFFSTMDWAYAGAFDLGGLEPGRYTITLTAMGCRKQTVQVDVNQNVDGLLVVMPREGR